MSDWKTHVGFGVVVSLVFTIIMHIKFNWFVFGIEEIILYIIIIYYFSMLPDIDHKMSKVNQINYGVGIVLVVVGAVVKSKLLYFGIGILIITYFFANYVSHRGPVHKLGFAVLFAMPLLYIYNLHVAVLSIIAYCSHLFIDKFFH